METKKTPPLRTVKFERKISEQTRKKKVARLSPDNHFICDCPYRDEGIFRSNLDVKTL
jgi:hypothetical protein